MFSTRVCFQAGWVVMAMIGWPAGGLAAPPPEYGRIELLRDRWGTPHVFATTDAGAMYGLGYATAEDRLYQMNFNLRLMQGRLAEVVGDLPKRQQRAYGPNSALEEDRLMRTIGFARHASAVVEKLDPPTRALLRAYCAGVNDSVARQGDGLHPLFADQGWRPEPWTEADCLLSWWQVARFFSGDGLRDLWMLRQQDDPRRALLSRGSPVVDDDAAVVRREDVSDAWIRRTEEFRREHGFGEDAADGAEEPGPKFSHAWVLGGELTSTGSAVLVSDPQTPVWNPALFYEFHVVGETLNARGLGVAGSPLVLIGFTPHVAWGMSALGADQADLFLLRVDPARPDQYAVDGEWRAMTVWEEELKVAGGEPVELRVRETVYGPVVSEFALGRRNEEVALKRVPLAEPDRDTIQAAFAMLRARSAAAFGAALDGWRFPTANCIFGDRDGNIGYWSVGAIPVRSAHSPSPNQAHDGADRRNDWQTFVPHDLLPHVVNPQRGYLVTANHRTIQSFYRLTLGASTGAAGDTDRGWRIKQRIGAALAEAKNEGRKVTPAEVLAMQSDAVNPAKRAVVQLGYHLQRTQPDRLSGAARRSLAHLEAWYAEGAVSDLRVAGTELANEIPLFFREMTVPLARTFGGGGSGLVLAMKTLTARLQTDPEAAFSEEEVAFVDGALAAAWEACQQRYGADPARWRQAALQAAQTNRLGYQASLSGYPSLDPRWDVFRPALPVLDGSTILAQPGQSYTQFVDLADPDGALTVLPPGASEVPGSPYRFANLAAWAGGELHPAPLSREAVEALTVVRATLSADPQERAGRNDGQGRRPSPSRPARR